MYAHTTTQHHNTARAAFVSIVFCLLCVRIPPSATHAAPPPLLIAIHAGYDSYYHTHCWFPVGITIGNDGNDIRGSLVWRFPGENDGNIFHHDIDLPRGARKRITMPVFTDDDIHVGQLQLVGDDTHVLLSQDVQLEPLHSDVFTIGVFSSDTTVLNSLTAIQNINRARTLVIHLTQDDIPEYALLLQAFDVLFVHDIATATMSDAQRAALRQWVLLGGQLVVTGGMHAQDATAGVREWLPVRVGRVRNNVTLAALNNVIPQSNEEITLNTTVNEVQLLPSATAIDDNILISKRTMGLGTVFFTAFDLGILRVWSHEPTLWNTILSDKQSLDPTQTTWSENSLSEVIEYPSLHVPPAIVLLLFIIVYIGLVGPVNFLVLRKLKREELAWISIPVMVFVFVIGTYGAGIIMRGTTPEMMQLEIVQAFEHEPEGYATAHIGIFSPMRRAYTMQFAPDVLVRQSSVNYFDSNNSITTWHTDAAIEARDVLVDVSELRTLTAQQTVQIPIQVSSTLNHHQGLLEGTVQNVGDVPLTDAYLVYGNSATSLGTLAPGNTMPISIERDTFTLENSIKTPAESLFKRQQIITSLFSHDNGTTFFDEGAYLLVWAETQTIDGQLHVSSFRKRVLVLYIIQLATETP